MQKVCSRAVELLTLTVDRPRLASFFLCKTNKTGFRTRIRTHALVLGVREQPFLPLPHTLQRTFPRFAPKPRRPTFTSIPSSSTSNPPWPRGIRSNPCTTIPREPVSLPYTLPTLLDSVHSPELNCFACTDPHRDYPQRRHGNDELIGLEKPTSRHLSSHKGIVDNVGNE